MAWMSDEQYEFIRDSRDKKITARSARHTRTHCGKGGTVKFPSDFLSRKELKAMNGEVKSYRLNAPMSWAEFKELPDDLKVQYITAIRERFGCPDAYIAEMMGCSRRTLALRLMDLKCNPGKGGHSSNKWDKEKFYAWRSGADTDAVEESVEESCEAMDADISENEAPEVTEGSTEANIEERIKAAGPVAFAGNSIPVIPKGGTMTFQHNNADDILTTLKTLLSGVTVNMTVSWECIYE